MVFHASYNDLMIFLKSKLIVIQTLNLYKATCDFYL